MDQNCINCSTDSYLSGRESLVAIYQMVNTLTADTYALVHWVIISSGYGLLSMRRESITRNNEEILSIVPLGKNFSGIFIKLYHKSGSVSSAKWSIFGLGVNVLKKTCTNMLRIISFYFSCMQCTSRIFFVVFITGAVRCNLLYDSLRCRECDMFLWSCLCRP